jgi:hypothetical protein
LRGLPVALGFLQGIADKAHGRRCEASLLHQPRKLKANQKRGKKALDDTKKHAIFIP